MQLHPEDFIEKFSGATLNYYIDGKSTLNPNTLYQFWNLDWNDAMFAWVYMKTLEDGKDYWVVGTGCNSGKIIDRQALFYAYIQKQYQLEGSIVKKEGYSSNIDMSSKNRLWLGENNILMIGDAAGLVDQFEALEWMLLHCQVDLRAQGILNSDKNGTTALEEYSRLAQKICNQTKRNQSREINKFEFKLRTVKIYDE